MCRTEVSLHKLLCRTQIYRTMNSWVNSCAKLLGIQSKLKYGFLQNMNQLNITGWWLTETHVETLRWLQFACSYAEQQNIEYQEEGKEEVSGQARLKDAPIFPETRECVETGQWYANLSPVWHFFPSILSLNFKFPLRSASALHLSSAHFVSIYWFVPLTPSTLYYGQSRTNEIRWIIDGPGSKKSSSMNNMLISMWGVRGTHQ